MIKYELAKKLKDAGFPQDCNMRHYHPTHGMSVGIPHPDTLIDPEVVALPTLSELIEAVLPKCSNFAMFCHSEWTCGDYLAYQSDWLERVTGSTPEEAVANLWLELNKKD